MKLVRLLQTLQNLDARKYLRGLMTALGAGLLTTACAEKSVVAPHHDTYAPQITEYMASPAILLFSKTVQWRHNEGIAGADLLLTELASEKGYGVFTTANGAVFNTEDLNRFDVVVFNNVTGDALTTEQRAAFEDWMQGGGSWLGLHGSGDGSLASWTWYQDNLIGTEFIGHNMGPQFQSARLVTLAPDHPVMHGIPADWQHTDEWYSFDNVPNIQGGTLLLGLDETSYSPTNTVVDHWPEDLSMGGTPQQHPVIWAKCQSTMRAIYSAFGHSHTSYRDPVYRKLLSNAFDWLRDDRSVQNTGC